MQSRGIRNNNPGNIDFNAGNFARDPWLGEVGLEDHKTPRFTRFETPVYGIRAMAKILLNYQRIYNLDTVEKILHRWAPPNENSTDHYVDHVADCMGCGVQEPVDLPEDQARFERMLVAMIRHENGEQPYSRDIIQAGLRMALGKPRVTNRVAGEAA